MEKKTVERQLIGLLPNMRAWALSLTRGNTSAADDLVQDVAVKVLAAQSSFEIGTNFAAWAHRIMINHFITGHRARRQFVSVDLAPEIPVAPEQPGKIDLGRLSIAFDQLPGYMRDVLREIAIEDRSYEEVSTTSGCPVGTLKSRVHRARVTLRAHMEGNAGVAA